MKKEFPLKNLKSIEIDHENGLAIACYEEKKQELKIGEWYKHNDFTILLSEIGHSGICWGFGFNQNNCWHATNAMPFGNSHGEWQPANMKEVEKLLIGEAEKKGFKEGVRYESPEKRFKRTLIGELSLKINLIDSEGHIIFNTSTGKWAEIIEEKKPSKYIIKLTETTKPFIKELYYKCEIGAILNDTENKDEAFVFEHAEGVKMICEFIEESYDYKTNIITIK